MPSAEKAHSRCLGWKAGRAQWRMECDRVFVSDVLAPWKVHCRAWQRGLGGRCVEGWGGRRSSPNNKSSPPPGCGSRAPRCRILAATTAIFIFMIALITAQVASLGSTRCFPRRKAACQGFNKGSQRYIYSPGTSLINIRYQLDTRRRSPRNLLLYCVFLSLAFWGFFSFNEI